MSQQTVVYGYALNAVHTASLHPHAPNAGVLNVEQTRYNRYEKQSIWCDTTYTLKKLVFIADVDAETPMVLYAAPSPVLMTATETQRMFVWEPNTGGTVYVGPYGHPLMFQAPCNGTLITISIIPINEIALDYSSATAAEELGGPKPVPLGVESIGPPVQWGQSTPSDEPRSDVEWTQKNVPGILKTSAGCPRLKITEELTAAVAAGVVGTYNDGQCRLCLGTFINPEWDA